MKKSWLFFGILFFLNFVSAYGYYGSFSIQNLFYSLSPSDVFLGVAFILFFFFLNISFSRFSGKYGENTKVSWVPALALSIGLTYGISRLNFDISYFFYGLGFNKDGLLIFFLFLILVAVIYSIKKNKFKYLLIGFGILFIILGFTNLIYEKGASILIGAVLILFGSRFWRIFKKTNGISPESTWGALRRGGNKITKDKFVSRDVVKR
jgi:hypothetical protein